MTDYYPHFDRYGDLTHYVPDEAELRAALLELLERCTRGRKR